MQNFNIKNDRLQVSMSTYGAELMSIQTVGDSQEFIWQGDPNYWSRRALVMFPVVGSWPNDIYGVNGKQYTMPVNGFAKLSEFEVIKQTDNQIVLQLCSDDSTRISYPYDFRFLVEYTLEDTLISVKFTVENKSNSEIPFAVGAHPGFKWPFYSDEFPSDYSLHFQSTENIQAFDVTGKSILFLDNTNVLPLSHDIFQDGALFIHNLQSNWVELGSPKSPHKLRVYRDQFPYLILWSKTDEKASYLCIEPSLSIGSTETSFEERKGIVTLKVGETYTCQYGIEIIITP